MKKTTYLLLALLSISGFAQQKSTGDIALSGSFQITANFTLDNNTSLVTLVLKGPSDRWFAMGIGVNEGFGMGDGDALVFTTATNPNVSDRNFPGAFEPPIDSATAQGWTTISNVVAGTVRTLTLTRPLTNSDTSGQDFQFPYATTNSISIAGVRSQTANDFTLSGGHGGFGVFGTGTFTTLGVEDFSLNASTVFPNPSNGKFTVKTKTTLEKVSVYTQTGAFVKEINLNEGTNEAEVNIEGLSTGIYLLELQNATEKSWKKVVIE